MNAALNTRAQIAAELAAAQGNTDLEHQILTALANGEVRKVRALIAIRPQGDGEAALFGNDVEYADTDR